jgi:hypothetical protein
MKRLAVLASMVIAFSLALPVLSHEGEKDKSPMAKIVKGTGIEGRVVLADEVVYGARIYVYRNYEELNAFRPFVVSKETLDDGTFSLDLPGGERFYLVAKKLAAGEKDGPLAKGDAYAFHGSNPITVAPGVYTHVGFSATTKEGEATYVKGDDPDTGSIKGLATYQGEPLEGVRVSVYLDQEGDFRGQGYAVSPPTRKSGRFRFDYLPSTTYYLVARMRASGLASGPMKDGDYYGYYMQNPIMVKSGSVTKLNFELVSKAGEIGQDDSLFRETGTTISGRILSTKGSVVPGVYAFAYEEKVMAHQRPDFISREVDKKGNYTINLSTGGVWYIGARSSYGDSPGVGEWYGKFDGTQDHHVKVETGKGLINIDMVVEEILAP